MNAAAQNLHTLQQRSEQDGLEPGDLVDLLALAVAFHLRLKQAETKLQESRRQVDALLHEREQRRSIVGEAQQIITSAHRALALAGMLEDLENAGEDVYLSILHGAGVEITHQPRDASERSEEHTHTGRTLSEAVNACRVEWMRRGQ